MVVVRPFLIARRKAPILLEAIDQAFDPVALPIDRPIKRSRASLIRLARDRDADAPLAQVRPDLPAAVALIADNTLGAQSGPSHAWPLDRSLLHHRLKGRRFMSLAGRQDDGERLAVPVGAEMDFGTEAALAAAQGFRRWLPFFAPAAWWWARTTVAST